MYISKKGLHSLMVPILFFFLFMFFYSVTFLDLFIQYLYFFLVDFVSTYPEIRNDPGHLFMLESRPSTDETV